MYVGVTRRLLRRFQEHCSIRGGAIATSLFNYNQLVALYKIGDDEMGDRERREYEDLITLQLMNLHSNGPGCVRGGRWTTHYPSSFQEPKELRGISMPVICKCNLPASSFVSKSGHRFFTCPMRNTGWLTEDENFPLEYDDACDFFKPEWECRAAPPPNRCGQCRKLCGKYPTCFAHRPQAQNMELNITVVDSDD